MNTYLLNLPNELIEMIIFHIIGRPWKDDVRDFLSFTSTCRSLRRFVHDERYWKIMALRRDPTCDKSPETLTWFEYCKQISYQRTILGGELKESISRYNEKYFCTIEKVLIWPSKIRIYINERGNYSRGSIQNPKGSIIALVEGDVSIYGRPDGISPIDSKFSIANERSQYLGYLDFPYSISLANTGKHLIFQYGDVGYKNAILFRVDEIFINKYNLLPLCKT